MYLAKVEMFLRKEQLNRKQCFNGTFDTDCQRSAVPHLLFALVNMILEGPSVMNKSEQDTMGVNAGVVLSQLLIFNTVIRHRKPQSDATATRHDQIESRPYPSIWDY